MRLIILNILFLKESFCHVYEDTEEFSSYIGRLMNDDAWKLIIEDIDFLKYRCTTVQHGYQDFSGFDLEDYLLKFKNTFQFLQTFMHRPGGKTSIRIERNYSKYLICYRLDYINVTLCVRGINTLSKICFY